jgi:chemotaxis response regulator CheB
MGGTVIAQDPETAEAPSMPRSAIASGAVEFVLPLDEIPEKLLGIVRGESGPVTPHPEEAPC